MSLAAYDYEPFFEPFFTHFDISRLFDTSADTRTSSVTRERGEDASGVLRPRMDLYRSKDKNEMLANFELPGLTKDNVDISVHNNRLVVTGQCAASEELDEGGYAVHERRFGKFSRTLPLPTGIKPEDINAEMNNGVLTVKFPSSQPEKKAKKISIS